MFRANPLLVALMLVCASLAAHAQIAPSAYWKNQIDFPDDPFAAAGPQYGDPRWIKFAILLPPHDPQVVYFQDSRHYPFHYDFAVNHLDPFRKMTRLEFDAASLYEEGQQVVLGAVIMPTGTGWPPSPVPPEYGIEFVRRDAYTREQVRDHFNAVRAAVRANPSVKAYYFPSYEQIATAKEHKDWLAANGIEISSPARWADGNVVYSNGWALGTLKFFPAAEIDAAFLSGELTTDDILFTDGVPAEIPTLAGVITSAPSTPNSHVAILAQTFSIPFAYLALTEDVQKAQSLVGRPIVLRAYKMWDETSVRLIDTTGRIDDQTRAEILALKDPGELHITPIAPRGAYSANTDTLTPSDIRWFGGKAANYGLLRTSIPDGSRPAAAFSFDLWNAYLDQTITTGRTLRDEIAWRLSPYTWPPSDMAALAATLDGIRSLFRSQSVTSFNDELRHAVFDTLLDPQYGFDPYRKIRFRSSTNVEDSDQFTGAGLYDSYSGCLADDLDDDDDGPCLCDPSRPNERGVFRAIRRVFASFYNLNAYLERLRWGVDENQVGMAILVHHSFPDEIELANGVAMLSKTWAGGSCEISLVTQLGAVSVSNPVNGSIPEEVIVNVYRDSYYAGLRRGSNLVPLGATVMNWQQDYIDLAKLLVRAANRYEEVTGRTTYLLDFEYKKIIPDGHDESDGKLVVKQIRAVPQPDTTPTITPFLLNEPADFVVFQGEFGEVFANHRLKSLWGMQTRNAWLTAPSLAKSLYRDVTLDYLHGSRIRTLRDGLTSWPAYSHSFGADATIDSWQLADRRNRGRHTLMTSNVGRPVSKAQSPILTLSDFGPLTLQVDWDKPVPVYDWWGMGTTTTDAVRLWPRPTPQPGDKPQTRTSRDGADLEIDWADPRKSNEPPPSGLFITTSFYWPPEPKGIVAGYTAPLSRWDRTVIEGLTKQPVVLRGDYSQTYLPGHHNFHEHFIFEPRLEQGISPAQLNELRLRNVRLILFEVGFMGTRIILHGFDDDMSPADLDGDGYVDAADLALFGRYWRQTGCGKCGGADLSGDQRVDLTDLAAFAAEWLTSHY